MGLFKSEFEAAKVRLECGKEHIESTGGTGYEGGSDLASTTRESMADATSHGEVEEVVQGGMERAPQLHSHRAGVDAFMTGYCFAYYCLEKGERSHGRPRVSDNHSKAASWLGELVCVRNKLALSGKPIPLQICKSHFAKTSQNHHNMLQLLSLLFTQQT